MAERDFCYGDEAQVIVALVDHNLHLLKDAFHTDRPGALDSMTAIYEEGDDLRVDAFVPQDAATDIAEAMRITEVTMDVADLLGESTTATWHLLASRVRECLPEPAERDDTWDIHPEQARQKAVDAFLRTKAVKDFIADDGPEPDVVRFLARVFVDYAIDYGRGWPEAWSPIAVEMFLVDWAPRKVLWQDDDSTWVPGVLRLFVEWALKRTGVAARFRRETVAAVDQYAGDFTFGVLGGVERSPATAFAEKLVAAGVDLTDPEAMNRVRG